MQVDLSTLDDGFGHWLAGFVDGEGCFYIRPTATGYVCQFAIGLRPDDQAVVEEIVARTGIGAMRQVVGVKTQQVRWEVHRKADCHALITLFERYPLRAKKARDFTIWREAVAEWATVTTRRAGHDWRRMANLKTRLAERRICSTQERLAV